MLRQAGEKDFDYIFDLYMHPLVNRYLLYEKMDAVSFRPIMQELLDKGQLFIYENNGVATGMCKLVPQQHRNAHIVYVGGLAIHPDFTGKGEGMKMMQDIITWAKENGFLRIELSTSTDNEKAIGLYTKAGFEKEGILKKFSFLEEKNIYLDEVVMAYLF
jgi:RimJ/RimL family protein N-acetyltransferase